MKLFYIYSNRKKCSHRLFCISTWFISFFVLSFLPLNADENIANKQHLLYTYIQANTKKGIESNILNMGFFYSHQNKYVKLTTGIQMSNANFDGLLGIQYTPLFTDSHILGDVVDHGIASEFKHFKTFQKKIKDKYPTTGIYNVVGNHDVYNSGWSLWKKTCEPHTSSYYFRTKVFEWYFLDTASGTLGRPQFYDLKSKLQASVKPKLIFSHYPINPDIFYFNLSNPRERAALISLFAKNNVSLYCSVHYHKGVYYNYGPFEEYTLEAFGVGGAWHILHINEAKQSFSIKTFTN